MESLRRWRMRFSDTAPAPSRSHRPGCESPELVGRVHRQADDVLRKRDLGRILRADEARHNAVRWQLVLHLLGLQRGEEPAAGDRLMDAVTTKESGKSSCNRISHDRTRATRPMANAVKAH